METGTLSETLNKTLESSGPSFGKRRYTFTLQLQTDVLDVSVYQKYFLKYSIRNTF